jgi:hypothetical protein
MERFSAEVEILQNTEEIIKLRLSSDISASGFITNDVNLYNEPLTLITQVPWPEVTVTQGSSVNTYEASGGEVMYEALPNVGTTNRGDIILQQSEGLPVELKSFSASVKNNLVMLNWTTITEVNNYGFEIEKQVGSRQSTLSNWEVIGLVEGNGNSNRPIEYSFMDSMISTAGSYAYRLKQIDNDGSVEYSNEIEVEVLIPTITELKQNYPNPFNPATKLKYSISKEGHVEISIYNIVGEQVALLVNEKKSTGNFEVEFNGSNLPSGVYFYKLGTGNSIDVKKMILLK